MNIEIPAIFATWIRSSRGEEGGAWIDALPARVRDLADRWQVTIDGPLLHGGSGIAIPVRSNRTPLMLKISAPGEPVAKDIRALQHWAGRGMVRLIDYDVSLSATLLERLGPQTLDALHWRDSVPVLGKLTKQTAIEAVADLPAVQDLASAISTNLEARWMATGRPFPESTVEIVRRIIEEQEDDATDRMVNKDLHFENVLAGTRQPWVAIDPKPMCGAPEFGLGQIFWRLVDKVDGPNDLTTAMDVLADSGDLDRHKLRDWTLVRVVDYWLWALEVGLTEDPVRCEVVFDWLQGSGPSA